MSGDKKTSKNHLLKLQDTVMPGTCLPFVVVYLLARVPVCPTQIPPFHYHVTVSIVIEENEEETDYIAVPCVLRGLNKNINSLF